MNSLIIVFCAVSVISFASCDDVQINYVSTPRHGSNNATENEVYCPNDGCITAISVSTFGPYGEGSGTAVSLTCPPGQCVSEFFGMAGKYLSALSIRCRPANVLEGEGTAVAGSAQGIYAETFPTFDDKGHATGARPIGVSVWNYKEVESIQVHYANIPCELCQGAACHKYKEETGSFYGQVKGSLYILKCPDYGGMTEMTFSYNGYYITSLQITCKSALSETKTRQIGSGKGTEDKVQCPPGIYCVNYGGYGSVKFDAFGGLPNEHKVFTEKSFLDKGYRPILIRSYCSTELESIETVYSNVPLNSQCTVSKIEVTDTSIRSISDGFEVIGIASGTSCTPGSPVLNLDYNRELSESVEIEKADTQEVNWGTSVSCSGKTGFNLFGNKASVELSLSVSAGGSKSYTTAKTTGLTTTTSTVQAVGVTYVAPGACVVIGYVKRYKINRDKVPVRYYFSCENGSIPTKYGSIKLNSKTYGQAYFEDYQFQYTDSANCSPSSIACVKALDVSNAAANSTLIEEKFKACFTKVSGTYSGKKVR